MCAESDVCACVQIFCCFSILQFFSNKICTHSIYCCRSVTPPSPFRCTVSSCLFWDQVICQSWWSHVNINLLLCVNTHTHCAQLCMQQSWKYHTICPNRDDKLSYVMKMMIEKSNIDNSIGWFTWIKLSCCVMPSVKPLNWFYPIVPYFVFAHFQPRLHNIIEKWLRVCSF